MLIKYRLNLAWLYPEPPYFYLIVFSSEKLEIAVRKAADDIPCSIESPFWLAFLKNVINKTILR